MTATIGLDIGGTKIAAGLVSSTGEILAETRRDTPAHDPDRIAHDAAELVAELAQGATETVVGVGVACAGFVDRTGSHVLFAPNLAWRDEPLKQRLEALVDYPVTIENDANAAAWGEFRFGAAHDADDMVLITVGTGRGRRHRHRLEAAARRLRRRRRARAHARGARRHPLRLRQPRLLGVYASGNALRARGPRADRVRDPARRGAVRGVRRRPAKLRAARRHHRRPGR